MKNVMLVTGAGQIGLAIARRMGAGMKIVIATRRLESGKRVAELLNNAGFDAAATQMDLGKRESIVAAIAMAQEFGPVTMLVNAAGVSPSQASIEQILRVDLYGTSVMLEEVGRVIAPGRRRITSRRPGSARSPASVAPAYRAAPAAPAGSL